ncbi:MAG: alpha/beta fold hydrolase, partial [Micromonosporaceae bacterium]
EIGWLLDHADGDAIEVTGVPNARVAADVEAARLLTRADGLGTVGDLRLAAGKVSAGLDPEELYQLGADRGWSVAVGWAAGTAGGSLTALFRRGPGAPTPINAWRAGEADDEPVGVGDRLTNAPLQSWLPEDLEHQVWELLRQSMPEGERVSHVVVLDELARTADGRIDPAALPAAAEGAPSTGADTMVPPRTAAELQLARIWERVLRVRSVDVRTSFFELGGDSLLAMRVVDEASEALHREVALAVLLRDPTIEGMAAALVAEPAPWQPLVEMTPGDGTPFFCVHPAGGNVLCYAELSRLIGAPPFYALQARGVEGDDPPFDDLTAMAARYLEDVRARQPSGPYLLGGWSMGGLVAYEMAQQLVSAGDRVGLLVLIETPTPDLIEDLPDDAAALAQLLDGVLTVDLAELRAMPAEHRFGHVFAEAQRAHVVPPGLDADRAQRLFQVYTTHVDAARRYRPRPYGDRACVLRAAEGRLGPGDGGWRGLLTGSWELIEVPGNHDTIVFPPNVQRLAEVLRAQLAAALVT